MNNSRKILISVTIAIAVVLVIGFLSRPTPQKTLECYTNQVKSMTIQQVSDLFNRPLVELSWLPDNMKLVPILTTYPSYNSLYPDHSECYIALDYVESASPQKQKVSITLSQISPIQSTKEPASCSLNFSLSSTINTSCSIDIDGHNSTLSIYVRLDADFSREDTLGILKGIRIIEPTIKPTPTPTV
jgi:hypothetical protein